MIKETNPWIFLIVMGLLALSGWLIPGGLGEGYSPSSARFLATKIGNLEEFRPEKCGGSSNGIRMEYCTIDSRHAELSTAIANLTEQKIKEGWLEKKITEEHGFNILVDLCKEKDEIIIIQDPSTSRILIKSLSYSLNACQ